MSNDERPEWTNNAMLLVERPKIDAWWKPEDPPLDGYLVWRGEEENRNTGDVGYLFAIRVADGRVVAVGERARLRQLRTVKLNSRVYIRCLGRVPLENGRTMLDFQTWVDERAALPSFPAAKPNGSGSADPLPF
jgi:hypothetical protein